MTSLVQANVTIQGSITSLGTFGQTTFAPVDLGVNSLSLATGNLTSLITTTSSAPTGFAAAGEGALVFPGTANAFISFGTYGQPFSNSNIYSFGDFVVEAWVNPVSFANSPILVGYGDPTNQNNLSWYFEIATNGQLQWFTSLNGTLSEAKTNTSLSLGAWTHIAAIHQSASKRVQIYINGTPQTFAVGSQGWSASGTILTYTTGIIPSSAYQTVIGQIYNSTYAYNGSLTNLRITTGSGAAQIYNNNAFTPSTTPLFPASNTAGGSLTTRLLVRVPLAPGKMVVPKLGGANCNTVLAFPPAPMTSYATNMTGQSYYGGGVYVASASTEYTPGAYYAWYAFDKSSATQWGGSYSYTTNVPYGGTVRTVDVNGTSYAGEWLQIQKPSSIVLSSYSILPQSGPSNTLSAWYVLGSRDGTNWFLIDQRSGATWTSGAYNTYQVQASQAFSYFRIVINIVSNGTGIGLPEWTLNGTIEGPSISADGRLGLGVSNPVQALEVAGSAVVAGTLSAGNPITFKNRLINGNFNVWQRGTTFSVTTNAYTADRWVTPTNALGTMTISRSTNVPLYGGFQYSISLGSANAGNDPLIEQRIEQLNTYDLYQGTPITISFWACQTVGTPGVLYIEPLVGSTKDVFTSLSDACTPTLQTAQLSANWRYYTFTYAIAVTTVATNGLDVQFWQPNAVNPATILLTGVQLEKGTVATPFEVRPFATELALCQRYYHRTYNNPSNSQFTSVCGFTVLTSTTAQGIYKLPVTMRSNVISSTYSFVGPNFASLDWENVSGLGVSGVSVTTAKASPDAVTIIATVSGATAGQVRYLVVGGGGYIDFSAEL
jgi:hypothetical protein